VEEGQGEIKGASIPVGGGLMGTKCSGLYNTDNCGVAAFTVLRKPKRGKGTPETCDMGMWQKGGSRST